ncbi:MAG: protein translocase subunit SecF, partial [Phycisphaerae bacterium]|nr:protein translocase subunit SecF [Phycisphaerae bacterium]NIU11132.1 protein translocase subunit SecF [Phycisphaerae bacterium]NIX01239.1 protein translocase subunit SecF [Phycisphaerae bacterium]
MDIIKPGTIVDFISKMKTAFIVSAVLIAIAVISLFAHKGLNWGVEFIGGTEVHIKFKQNIKTQEIKDKLAGIDYKEVSVQSLGLEADNEYILRLSSEVVKHDEIKDFQKQMEG